MKIYILFLTVCMYVQFSFAQVGFNLSIPVGLSNYTTQNINAFEEQLPPQDYQYNYGISSGFHLSFFYPLNKKLDLLIGAAYHRLQQKTHWEEERNAYSWTERNTNVRVAQHYIGIGTGVEQKLFSTSRSALKAKAYFGFGTNLINEGWIELERNNYFEPEIEKFSYYESETSAQVNTYFIPRGSLVYELGGGPRKILLEVGYALFHEMNLADYDFFEPTQWHNFYFSLGYKWAFRKSQEDS